MTHDELRQKKCYEIQFKYLTTTPPIRREHAREENTKPLQEFYNLLQIFFSFYFFQRERSRIYSTFAASYCIPVIRKTHPMLPTPVVINLSL